MSFRFVFTSWQTYLSAICFLLFTGIILFCAAAFIFSPVQANDKGLPQASSLQLEPTVVPNAQTDAIIHLPLVAHELIAHNAADEEAPLLRVMASSGHNGNSETFPPATNNHTFVADDGGYLDDYWLRSELPNGQLTFTIAITAPLVSSILHANQDGSLTDQGLRWMYNFHKLSSLSYLQLHLYDVDHDAPDCAEVDLVSINGYRIEKKWTARCFA